MGGPPQALGASSLTPSCQAAPGVFASLSARLANTLIDFAPPIFIVTIMLALRTPREEQARALRGEA